MAASKPEAKAGDIKDGGGGLEAMPPLDRLHEFCRRGSKVDVAELLGKDKTLLNKKGKSGNISSHWAASTGASEVLEYVLSLGASVNAQNDVGDTPLHLAVWKDHLAAVKVLKKYKADKNIENQEKKTAPQMYRSKTMQELLPEMDAAEVADAIHVVPDDDDDDDEDGAAAAAAAEPAAKPRPPPPRPKPADGSASGAKPPPPKPVPPAPKKPLAPPPPPPAPAKK